MRPTGGTPAKAALLGDLLAPYDDMGAATGRIRVAVPRMGVGDAATTTLALVVHELAANSLKYDALSVEAGMLDVSCDTPTGGMVVIWTERDGAPVTEPVGSRGYGSTLVSRATSGQLGSSIGYHWDTAGLIVSLRMNKDALAAQACAIDGQPLADPPTRCLSWRCTALVQMTAMSFSTDVVPGAAQAVDVA